MAIRLVKALAYDCVLGMDTLELFDVSINFKERTWQLRNGRYVYDFRRDWRVHVNR